MSARSTPNRSHPDKAIPIRRSGSPGENHAPSSPSKLPSHKSSALSSPNSSESSPQTTDEMSSTITTHQELEINGSVEVVGGMGDAEFDVADNGSSSLSEVDDVTDEEEIPVHSDEPPQPESDVDSEAETEHLEKTPKKPSIIHHGGAIVDRTPSKLSNVLNRDESEKLADQNSTIERTALDSASPSDADQPSATQSKGSLGKRKRGSSNDGESSDIAQHEPSPKRNHNDNDELQLALLDADNDQVERVEGSDTTEEKANDIAVADDVSGSNEQLDDTAVAIDNGEEATLPKGRFGRRGRRKGRKDVLELGDTLAENSDTPVQEPDEAVVEADEDEEHAREEELARRKFALDGLSTIEKEFIGFRERHLQEQLNQLESEMDLVRESNCQHPDYLAKLVCLDERRDEKIRYEDTLLKYNLMALVNRTIAERGTALSHFYQDIRRIRDVSIENCYKELYSLQKDRRRYGTEESSILSFSASRPDQMRNQASYNLEVSVLAGVSKHIGFPAAPDIARLTTIDLQQDLDAMGINRLLPTANAIRAQSFQDRTQAGDQFLEQTPWANPQHPAHANGPINNFHTQGLPNFVTPAPQRQYPVNAAINGSASTIEMMSNPPSSAAGPSHTQHYNLAEAPTPILNVRTQKDGGRIQTSHDSRIDSSPPSNPARVQQQQSSYPSPARNNQAIGMPIGVSAFGGT